ncbi:MAG: hypothetical protein H6765_10455 [Candidatus Peribacteria bacterium]|nr:MAG: hypothetical protein H6765_10455 [Candidatus Peribacteria bacterium]
MVDLALDGVSVSLPRTSYDFSLDQSLLATDLSATLGVDVSVRNSVIRLSNVKRGRWELNRDQTSSVVGVQTDTLVEVPCVTEPQHTGTNCYELDCGAGMCETNSRVFDLYL